MYLPHRRRLKCANRLELTSARIKASIEPKLPLQPDNTSTKNSLSTILVLNRRKPTKAEKIQLESRSRLTTIRNHSKQWTLK